LVVPILVLPITCLYAILMRPLCLLDGARPTIPSVPIQVTDRNAQALPRLQLLRPVRHDRHRVPPSILGIDLKVDLEDRQDRRGLRRSLTLIPATNPDGRLSRRDIQSRDFQRNCVRAGLVHAAHRQPGGTPAQRSLREKISFYHSGFSPRQLAPVGAKVVQ